MDFSAGIAFFFGQLSKLLFSLTSLAAALVIATAFFVWQRLKRGRRMADEDARQIGRWKAISRHVRQIQKNCEPGRSVVPAATTTGAAALGL